MEFLYPPSYYPNLNLLMQNSSSSTKWTKEENKKFERALAIYDDKTPDRWLRVAAMIPGKSVSDVLRQYVELESDVSDIEAGLVPIPGYLASSFTLEMGDDHGFYPLRKGSLLGRASDQEGRKGVPWTEDEHRRFLMGLQKHGKGDWRNISRNFVISKTPTQVASHAQKYFMRQNSSEKDKRRPSINDITTIHLTQTDSSVKANRESPSLDKSNQNQPNGAMMIFDSNPSEIAKNGLKLQRSARLGTHVGLPLSSSQIQYTRYDLGQCLSLMS
ncbi:transcription factor DIVARICATA-like [Actinidia eriantha]|uniref:transcription factor DIVARICATA-like n=1 Tax=Actinidia eriantha TaxID=165200 RepID=UPI002587F13B|nr:transcription factor DIVARICATA-like [Actinidia eriantha]